MLALTVTARGVTNDLTGLLQQGLFEEEANRNMDAAISNYQTLANAFDKDRQVAATAIFRLGECYRKLGQTNEAAAQYQRIVREFSDQQTLVTLSKQNLAGLGAAVSSPQAPQSAIASDAVQQLQSTLVKEEAEYAQKSATLDTLKKMKPEELRKALPTVVPDDQLNALTSQLDVAEQNFVQVKSDYSQDHPKYQAAKEQVDVLQQKVKARRDGIMTGLQAQLDASLAYIDKIHTKIAESEIDRSLPAPITDEEEKEIRRIQQMIQNSPDLINVGSLGANGNWTPLYQAARSGWLRVATFLLDHGANVEAASGTDGTPLYAAAEFGNQAMVELLLSHGADVNAGSGSVGTALHVAAEKGFAAVTETLLNHKADVNARDFNERTPLHVSARAGQVQTMKLLLAHGADVNAKDGQGSTPLVDALHSGPQRCVPAVETLLAAKPDVNVMFGGGKTVLASAAARGSDEIVKLLLEAKADPNGGTNYLPLTGAIDFGGWGIRSNICRMLLQAGADPNRADPAQLYQSGGGFLAGTDTARLSPIQRAVILGQADIVKMLLDYKADANAPGLHQTTLLWEAVANSRTDIAEALLAHGADANARSDDDKALLAGAVEQGDRKIVEALLAHGAEVNARSRSDVTTALHIAVLKGNGELVALLIANKADVNVRDKYGKTPLDYAKEKEQPGQVALGPGMVRPMIPAPPARGGAPGPSWVPAPPEDVVKLLRQHGAVDELPNFDVIRVTREGISAPIVAFVRPSNDWNHYTLLETMLPAYSGHSWVGNSLVDRASVLKFPDLRRIIIHRPNRASLGKRKEITVDLLNDTNGIDCGKDVPVEFGDVVEIPIRDYSLGEAEVGLTQSQWTDLKDCLKKTVRLVVRDESRELTLNVWSPSVWSTLQLPQAKSLLLASSDLAHVKVTRKDSSTGKKKEFIVDATANRDFQDLRLENGDVIEVPEKAGE